MKIIFNAANIRVGGSLQVSQQLAEVAIANDAHRWHFILHKKVQEVVNMPLEGPHWSTTVVTTSPGAIIGGLATRKKMRSIEDSFAPDCVFTVFGPAYFRFQATHLMGFAVPWVTHPTELAWATIPTQKEKIRFKLWCEYVAFWTRFADDWVLESKTAAEGLARKLGKDPTRFHVVPNTCGQQYYKARDKGVKPNPKIIADDGAYVMLVFSAWYYHKNLESIPKVAAELKKLSPERKFRFVLTLPEDQPPWQRIFYEARRLNVDNYLQNIGPQKPQDGPSLYAASDALFLPTFLETFTAAYPEAMCMRRPIITTDLDFARAICQDAARYFKPKDATSAAEAILEVSGNEDLREKLMDAGDNRLLAFGRPEDRLGNIIKILEKLVAGKRRG